MEHWKDCCKTDSCTKRTTVSNSLCDCYQSSQPLTCLEGGFTTRLRHLEAGSDIWKLSRTMAAITSGLSTTDADANHFPG